MTWKQLNFPLHPLLMVRGLIGYRVGDLSRASKDAPSTGSAPAHGPTRADTPPLSQNAPSQQHHSQSTKPESGSADKDGAAQSSIQPEADTGNSPMQS